MFIFVQQCGETKLKSFGDFLYFSCTKVATYLPHCYTKKKIKLCYFEKKKKKIIVLLSRSNHVFLLSSSKFGENI